MEEITAFLSDMDLSNLWDFGAKLGAGAILVRLYDYYKSGKNQDKKVLLMKEKEYYNRLLKIQDNFNLNKSYGQVLQKAEIDILIYSLTTPALPLKESKFKDKIQNFITRLEEFKLEENLVNETDDDGNERYIYGSNGDLIARKVVKPNLLSNFKRDWKQFMFEYDIHIKEKEIRNQ